MRSALFWILRSVEWWSDTDFFFSEQPIGPLKMEPIACQVTSVTTTVLRCVKFQNGADLWTVHCSDDCTLHSESFSFWLSTVQYLIMQKWNTKLREPDHLSSSWQMWGCIHFSRLIRHSLLETADETEAYSGRAMGHLLTRMHCINYK